MVLGCVNFVHVIEQCILKKYRKRDMAPIRFGILTVSDSCFAGDSEDKSGPILHQLVSDAKSETGKILNGIVCQNAIVRDDINLIMDHLISWCDIHHLDVIITTGGTGFSERDVTPEATKKVIDKEVPGIVHAMFLTSFKITPLAMLSRATCGIRKGTLIINLPGSPKAVKECLEAIAPAIPHAIDLLTDNKAKIQEQHKHLQSITNIQRCCHKNIDVASSVADRYRKSPYPMISVEDALKIITDNVRIISPESVNLKDSLGRVLQEPAYNRYDLPPFRASIKDGYAVIAKDGKGKRHVVGNTTAGNMSMPFKLQSGMCVRVNTGAPVPDDATAVVQVEDTVLIEKEGLEEKQIEILTEPKVGQDIRPVGSDMKKGSYVLPARLMIDAGVMGILAASGYTKVAVYKKPSVGVLSTGDELQEPGEDLLPGHVYDSNKITLISLLKENGLEAKDMGIARDSESSMIHEITKALEQVDVLVTTGSVSMGDRDLLKPIMEKHFKAKVHFGRVNMKPGKPTTFATCNFNGQMKYLLCLPGNPASATVTSHLFLLPLLRAMQGLNTKNIIVDAKLTSSYDLDIRPEYARVTLKWKHTGELPYAYSTGNQISSAILNFRNANALIMLPGRTNERPQMKEGDIAKAMLLGVYDYDDYVQ